MNDDPTKFFALDPRVFQSESLNELSAALAKAEAEMPHAELDSENPHFRSAFSSLGAIRKAVIPSLTKYGLSITQTHMPLGETTYLRTTLHHSSGQWISGLWKLKPVKDDPQGMSSANTYGKRVGISSMVGVVGEEDDDGNAATGSAGAPQNRTFTPSPPPASRGPLPRNPSGELDLEYRKPFGNVENGKGKLLRELSDNDIHNSLRWIDKEKKSGGMFDEFKLQAQAHLEHRRKNKNVAPPPPPLTDEDIPF